MLLWHTHGRGAGSHALSSLSGAYKIECRLAPPTGAVLYVVRSCYEHAIVRETTEGKNRASEFNKRQRRRKKRDKWRNIARKKVNFDIDENRRTFPRLVLIIPSLWKNHEGVFPAG